MHNYIYDNIYKSIKELDPVQDVRNVYYKKEQPKEIWNDVAENDEYNVIELSKAMKKLVYRKSQKHIIELLAKILYDMAYKEYGLFIAESDYWADFCKHITREMMAFLQRQYTLAHATCSTACIWDELKEEMLCMRSLDWAGADEIAKCTRIFKFIDENSKDTFQAAGIAGMVGILTGMKNGFSICINYAPWHSGVKFKRDPLFAIRILLQDNKIQTYNDAKKNVMKWDVSSPCFITICGTKKGEACVIEIGDNDKYIREIQDNNFIVQTNHFTSPQFVIHNDKFYKTEPPKEKGGWYYSKLLKNSHERRKRIEENFSKLSNHTNSLESEIFKTYLIPPVLNYETAQWVVMRPKSNSIKVFKCTSRLDCPEKRRR